MVIYIDSVFLLNGCMDAMLLYFTGYLAGIERSPLRLALAGTAGGAYAVGVLLLPALSGIWGILKLLTGFVLVWIGYGWKPYFFRLCLTFLGLSCAAAGMVIAVSYLIHTELCRNGAYLLPFDGRVLLLASALTFGSIYLFSKGSLRHRMRQELLPVRCSVCGREVRLRALWDTGNTLCDPVSGGPVLVADHRALRDCWPAEVKVLFQTDTLQQPAELLDRLQSSGAELPLRLLSYRSVGCGTGLLLICTGERATIGERSFEKIPIALSPTPVSEHGEFDALWGGEAK